MATDRLYVGTEQILMAFSVLGASTNADVAKYLKQTPNHVLQSVVRYRNRGLLAKVSSPLQRVGEHVITQKGLETLNKPRRKRRLQVRLSAKESVLRVPNSIFSLAACMGLAEQPTYHKDTPCDDK